MISNPNRLKFDPRWYQEEIFDAIENKGYRRVLWIAARRSGKDITCWNLAIRQCLRKTCLVFYCLPTYAQARKAIFDAISSDEERFLNYLPTEFVASINIHEQKIRFINDSILQCIGADTYNTSLVGSNPFGIVLSEFSLMDPEVLNYARPILAANGGWLCVNSTPRGKNALWHLWKVAQELSDWHIAVHKTSEIQHIPADVLRKEREQMDEGLYLQEYECSFERGIEGAIYGRHLDRIRLKNQITHVPWEPGLLVYTSWDIGVNDATTIIFFQVVGEGTLIRIIDCYSNTGLGLDHYAKIIQDKPFKYGKHFAPADIKVREWGGGAITRFEKARQLDLNFTILDQIPVQDGIENVWTHFDKFWIDDERCRSLIDAIENYRREWDEKKQMYSSKPVHNWASNFCDALRYMCAAIHKTKKGRSAQDYERAKRESLYINNDLPRFFRNDPRYNG